MRKLPIFFLLGVVAAGAFGAGITFAYHPILGGEQRVLTRFHQWYYDHSERTWLNTRWLGARNAKLPSDLWVYQEIIYEVKPDILIEAGTFEGGSAYYFASLFDLMNKGRVVTIDIEDKPGKPQHKRITYLLGSSTSDEIYNQVKANIHPNDIVMVSLDSDHHRDHVLKELNLYGKLVTPGSYIVVEDSNVNGHPVAKDFGPGPMEALEEFLKNNPGFKSDLDREKFGVTFYPNGWIKRVN